MGGKSFGVNGEGKTRTTGVTWECGKCELIGRLGLLRVHFQQSEAKIRVFEQNKLTLVNFGFFRSFFS